MTPHIRRLFKTIASVAFVLLLAGVTYQGVATALERRAYKYPGRLVPVGDHQLHLHCVGAGAPTIVLEAPALGFSASWTLIQPALAKTSRVCAYDRAGLGWSEASEGRFDSRVVPDELRRLLAGAGERAPYLLVGDGLGAAYVMQFAAQFPTETAGLVLLDSLTTPAPGARSSLTSPSPWLARIGILRLEQALSGRRSRLANPSDGAVKAFSTRPDHLTRAAQEARQIRATLDRASTASLPVGIRTSHLESPDGHSLLDNAEHATRVRRLVADAVRDWRSGR